MGEPDDDALDLAQTLARMAQYLTADEAARLKRELVRFANQDSAVPPRGFVQLVQVAQARGYRPV